MQVLHLTAHMGGGVGKALSGLVAQASVSSAGVQHSIVCLEEPDKTQFVDAVRSCGGEVIVLPRDDELRNLVLDADIVQLEWWNHPATIRALCSLENLPIRLLTWSHVSGLHNPIIPRKLILASHLFLFTSACSLEGEGVKSLLPELVGRLGVVPSSGGFSGFPAMHRHAENCISVGYVGSLNFAKLHPGYVDYVAAVGLPGFRVAMIGDRTNMDFLNHRCESLGKPGMLEFRGYSTNVVSELATINVLAYLLNPEHYGTAENALLEAMAMGVVPVVLDNPAERQIVDNHLTGLIVHSPSEFAQAIRWLSENPRERQRLAYQAARSVRQRFSAERMEASLNSHYRKVLSMDRKAIAFTEIFGREPADWFLSCQAERNVFAEDGSVRLGDHMASNHYLFEKTKGTVFHFADHFPDNARVKSWAEKLRSVR